MATMVNAKITELAAGYLPILFFDPLERFFPVAAEEWLTHQAAERWDAMTTHQRGTAVLLSPKPAPAFGPGDVQAGSDTPAGAPLTLDALPPNGIGQAFAVDPATQDLFLDSAGWDDTTTEVMPGNRGYATGS